MRARLVVEAGKAEPAAVDLLPGETVLLGRDPKNTIVVRDDIKVSRQHTEVFYQNGAWQVRNLSEKNKTFLDEKSVGQATSLRDGQVIRVSTARLRFVAAGTKPPAADKPAVVVARPVSPYSGLDPDELTALVEFMDASLQETSPHGLIELALQKVLERTGASVGGFLGLDHEDAPLKIVLPAEIEVDTRLSRQLTTRVRATGGSVWLATPGGNDDIENSSSLANYADALCVPVRRAAAAEPAAAEPAAGGEPSLRAATVPEIVGPPGTLHVYHTKRTFAARDLAFCEVIANCLANTLHVLRSRRALEADNSRLREQSTVVGDELLGSSQVIRQLRGDVMSLAVGPCTVLIEGESGVGKELVARALHRNSPRHDGPLVSFNCAALNSGLLGAELFGHERGAFSGAERARPGLFQQADEGTLFLDEIGELSAEGQARLLRVLETKRVWTVGADAEITVDVRILAATNRDLEKEMRAGRFRRDLFYRLGARLHVPPLRDHPEDIPELAAHFLDRLNREYGRHAELAPEALERLQSYSWPGNVRQLRSVLETAVAMSRGGTLRAANLRLEEEDCELADGQECLNLERLEARAISEALARTGGVLVHAAKILGIHRETLINKMKKYKISPRPEPQPEDGVG